MIQGRMVPIISAHHPSVAVSPVTFTRFPSSPLIIRVPFFLLFGFDKGTQKEKG